MEDDDERFRCLKGFSRLSMKLCTETYGSSLGQGPDNSERERKEPERRRGEEDIDRASEKEEDVVSLVEEDLDLGWGNEAERVDGWAGTFIISQSTG